MKQKKMICALACALCLLGGGASLAAAPAPASTAPAAETAAPLVSSVTSLARNYGWGEQVSQIALEYHEKILTTFLSAEDFSVEGKEIASVWAATTASPGEPTEAGRYVIINIKNTNPQSDMPFKQGGSKGKEGPKNGDASMKSDRVMPDLSVKVTQTGPIRTAKGGETIPAGKTVYTDTSVLEPDISGFIKHTYTDPALKATIPYYLYLPKGYDKSKSYPLLVFIPDASTNISDPKITLVQGNGATVWASEEEQKKHPSIVLAVQYPQELVDSLGMMTTDENVWTKGLTLVTDLIHDVTNTYAVDTNRIYGTGQSQGGMANIAISDKYPDLFAAQFLVACQWNTQEMEALKDKNLWILVSEGDTKAYPGMNDAVSRWEKLGTKVATAPLWNSHADSKSMADLVRQIKKQDAAINYTVFQNGNHMYTWTFAYNIPGIRDWLYLQTLDNTPVSFNESGLSQGEKHEIAGEVLSQGLRFYNGKTEEDAAKALAYFKEADKLGHMKAARYIGLLYQEGRGVPKNDKETASWFKKGAEDGDITSQYLLGKCYEDGTGVERDYALALKWYRKSAERGDIIAAPGMTGEALLLEKGLGGERNLPLARQLLTKAAALGYAPAKEALAAL